MTFSYETQGTCSTGIEIQTEGDVIRSVQFVKGCAGNTQGISALLPGMTVDEAITRLAGIECRNGTSCPDQLSKALRAMKEKGE